MGDVIDFFSRRLIKDNAGNSKKKNKDKSVESNFEKAASRNKANQERLRKEREQANKNVIKSYRIK